MRSRFPSLPSASVLAVTVLAGLAAVSSRAPHVERPAAVERERGSDDPLEAVRWIQMAQRDEFGNIAPNGLMNAKRQVDAMRARQRAAAGRPEPIASIAGIGRNAWTWIGPGNIGGRTRAISINPNDTQDILAAGVAGGIWRTFDAGGGWTPIDDFMANLAVSTIARRPGEPGTILAGTGEGFFNADSIRGAGVFRSTDNGASWTQLGSTTGAEFLYVNRLAFSADGSTVLAATRSGLFRSTDVGDGWDQRLSVSNMTDVRFLPGSSTQAVVSGFSKNAYYSSDGGVTWTLSGGLSGGAGSFNRVELGVSNSSPLTVYASYAAGGTSSTPAAEVWKSTNGGASYSLTSAPGHLSSQGWYDNAVWIDPTNVNHVVLGGVSRYRSTDGTNFGVMGGTIHVDHHIIVSDPGYDGGGNRRVYYGNDGGVYRLEDSLGTSFTRLNNNYGVTQFYGGAGHAASGKIVGGTQDNGTLVYTPAGGPQNWTSMFGGDGGFSAADQTDPNYLYGELQWLGVHRSSNGGASSTRLDGCSKGPPYRLDDACDQLTNFISPILLDPNEPNRLLAGARRLWRTNDVRTPTTGSTGPAWAWIKSETFNNSNISSITVAVGNSDLVWIGHNNGDVYKTTNGTDPSPIWTKVDDGWLPGRTATSIALDPANPDVVYVSFGGFSTGNVWRSTNAGATWSDVSGGLPSAPVRSVVTHPTVANWIYAGTDVGVFASETAGASWQVPHDGPANVAVFQLFWMNLTLVAVTHGRGMYTADASSSAPNVTLHPTNRSVVTGGTVSFTAAASGLPAPTWQWQVWNGMVWVDLANTPPYSGVTTPTLTITGAAPGLNGAYYRAVVSNAAGVTTTAAGQLTVYGAGANFIQNGDFSGGPAPWQVFEIPDIVWNIVGGVFEFYRQSPPTTASGQAVVFQHTGTAVGAGTPLAASFDLGNTSSVRKRITVLILDSTFADLHVCTFFLGPNAPLRTYQMRTHSNQVWANAAIYFYAATGGSNGGNYQLDNVSLAYDPAASATRTDCIDPTAPVPPGGASSANLLTNGDFGAGLSPWGTFGAIVWQIAGGVFEFYRSAGLPTPAAVVFQNTGVAMPAGQIVTATFQLGNSSGQRQRVTVLVQDGDFTDLTACTFWLLPGQALGTYTMRTFATKAWTNATVSIYSATVGVYQWIRVDNATLQTTPASTALGTECFEPPPGPIAAPGHGALTATTRQKSGR